MFETAELGRSLSRKELRRQEPFLRTGLLTVQYELRDADFPLLLVVAGPDRAGASSLINLLHEWMDARYLEANIFEARSEEEREQPRFWRYWRALPAKGRIGIFHREWTARAIEDRAAGEIDDAEFDERLRHIVTFEKALVDDGGLLVKYWLHVSERALARRLDEARRDSEDGWTATRADRFLLRHYRKYQAIAERAVRRTSVGGSLWNIVESEDWRYRNVAVAQTLIQVLTRRLAEPPSVRAAPSASVVRERNPLTVLDHVDLKKKLDDKTYEKQQDRYWAKLARLGRRSFKRGLATVAVFEGWDAAGKGGVIRRLTKPLDAARYRVVPISAPTEDERAHHYLWRFWRQLPRSGHWTIFDRSWYGRVLVERLEGLATENEWRRAYAEINDFEEILVRKGIVLIKFWLHISPEEQLRRFKAREKVPFKKYKITEEDYRNRERWNAYELAANEMIQRTSSDYARWHLVPGNDKRWARVQVLKTVSQELERALK